MQRRRYKFLLYWFLATAFWSCKDCPAVPSTVYEMTVEMYYYDSLIQRGERVAYTDTFSTVGAIDLGRSLYEESFTGSWVLPLSNQSSQVTFEWTDTRTRSLQVGYDKTPIPLSPDCGIYEIYENLTIISHDFDSVRVVKSLLEIGDELHIEIFTNP